jgi:hypothetical protein
VNPESPPAATVHLYTDRRLQPVNRGVCKEKKKKKKKKKLKNKSIQRK